MHAATIEPGRIRGNHFHRDRDEAILVIYLDSWVFCSDSGPDTQVAIDKFAGSGAVVAHVPRGHSHAVSNTGRQPLVIVSLSNGDYDSESGETQRRVVAD